MKEHTQRQGRARGEETKEHSQLQVRTDKEEWLRQTDRKDPRSGRVAAKIRSRDVTRIQDKDQDDVLDQDHDEDKFEEESKVEDGLGVEVREEEH